MFRLGFEGFDLTDTYCEFMYDVLFVGMYDVLFVGKQGRKSSASIFRGMRQ
jgi:hypothetical protein